MSDARIGKESKAGLDASYWAAVYYGDCARDRSAESVAAQKEGKAYGHAFRAAELAYETGLAHSKK